MPASTLGLFAILAQKNFDQIGQAIQREYPDDNCPLVDGQWFLSAPGSTTKQISDKLGITVEPPIGSAIVISFASYFGRANPQIWEWLKAKMGQ